ncbi:hypothetical protein RQP46_000062 [Phenoliferia psychrophenolica]
MSFGQHSFTERHTFNEVVQGTYQLAHGEMMVAQFVESEYLSTGGSSRVGVDSHQIGIIKECRVEHSETGDRHTSRIVLEFWLLTTLGRGTKNLHKRALPNSVLTTGHYLIPVPDDTKAAALPSGTITSRTSNRVRDAGLGGGFISYTFASGDLDICFADTESWVVVPILQQTFQADEEFYTYPGVLQMASQALDCLIVRHKELQLLELAAEPFTEHALDSDPPGAVVLSPVLSPATPPELTEEQREKEEDLDALLRYFLTDDVADKVAKDEQVASWVGAPGTGDGSEYEQWEEQCDDLWEEDPEEQWEEPSFGE